MKLCWIFAIVFFLVGCSYVNKVCFEDKCVNVEVAYEESEQQKGLMFRENLDKNSGMLFIYDGEDMRGFWMKNTLIALDMLWIDKDKNIVYIKENALPCEKDPCEVYGSLEKSKYILEVNAGFVMENDIKVGDEVALDIANS